MIIVMNNSATDEEISFVVSRIKEKGLDASISKGTEKTVIGAVGDERLLDPKLLDNLPGVEQALRIVKPYKIVAREWHPEDTVIDIKGHPIGGKNIQVISGPCSVETPIQMKNAAEGVKAAGVKIMRGGAFKPRTSPYSFQGTGFEGLEMFRVAADNAGLPIVTELLDVRHLDKFLEQKVDVIQIGTRSMQNFELLREVGRLKVPVILKRGMSATISEWLMAAEYIASGGNHNIIFCERGIRTFETYYRKAYLDEVLNLKLKMLSLYEAFFLQFSTYEKIDEAFDKSGRCNSVKVTSSRLDRELPPKLLNTQEEDEYWLKIMMLALILLKNYGDI